jgi:hypothetical protein
MMPEGETRICAYSSVLIPWNWSEVAQRLAGEAPDLPRWGVSTFRKAAGTKRDEEHPELFE